MTTYSASLDRTFHALSDPTRRAILTRLGRGSASVSELSRPFDMSRPTLLQHIRVLERSGLISTRKTGRVRTCEVRPASILETEKWLAAQRSVWEGRLGRLEAYAMGLLNEEAGHVPEE